MPGHDKFQPIYEQTLQDQLEYVLQTIMVQALDALHEYIEENGSHMIHRAVFCSTKALRCGTKDYTPHKRLIRVKIAEINFAIFLICFLSLEDRRSRSDFNASMKEGCFKALAV